MLFVNISRLTIAVTLAYKTYMNIVDAITPCVRAHISHRKIHMKSNFAYRNPQSPHNDNSKLINDSYLVKVVIFQVALKTTA